MSNKALFTSVRPFYSIHFYQMSNLFRLRLISAHRFISSYSSHFSSSVISWILLSGDRNSRHLLLISRTDFQQIGSAFTVETHVTVILLLMLFFPMIMSFIQSNDVTPPLHSVYIIFSPLKHRCLTLITLEDILCKIWWRSCIWETISYTVTFLSTRRHR
jgi:hypothetical protein